MASGLLIKQKQLLAGDGIAINHGETASTISLAENALDNAVRIYDATVEAETGVVTITDGTQVSELAIGDEIRTPDGVYQKIKDSTTTEGPADGTRIEVSGITSPVEANGLYILTETDRKWKHESADYWILVWQNTSWMISPVESGANPGYSLFYGYMSSPSMPWEVTSWSAMSGAAGTPVVENAPAEQVITNTIDLFEYASLPVEPKNIVQSVNGNKPDASGDVTIETGGSIDESRLLPEAPDNGDVPVFNAAAATGGAWENQNLNEQIDSKIATHNSDPSAHPDKLSLTGGQMTGELKINATNALRINNGDYGIILRKDASSFYIMVTAQGDPNGSYTEARPLKIDLATGECSINGGAFKDSNGNVIVTTYAPLNHPTFSGGVEITGATPYIDFHFNNSESDYTFRIVQNSEDTLTLGGKVNVANNLTVASGGMSVAGNIKNTGEIQSETYNSYRLVSGNYGTFWRNDGNDLYLMLTNSGDQYGSYNDLRPLSVDLATGDCSITGNAVGTESKLSSAGVYPRVSMNTTATADFNTFKAQGNYWFAFGVRPNGPLGDDAETTGVLNVYNIRNTHTLQVYNMYNGTGVTTQQMYYRWCYNGTWTAWTSIEATESIGSTSNDYNTLTEPGDYYLSFGQNTSNVNAPANGPFHILVHRYQNVAGTAKPILQIAASQIVSEDQTPTMFFRSASYANSAWTFQPWLRLLTEKDIKYVTGSINTGIGEEKNDYIVIGNCVIYIGQFKKILPASGSFYLPVSASNVTIMMGLAKTDSNAKAPTSIACNCSGTSVTYNIDGELSSGYVYINWIGIGYLS